jgi:hypothetical protein
MGFDIMSSVRVPNQKMMTEPLSIICREQDLRDAPWLGAMSQAETSVSDTSFGNIKIYPRVRRCTAETTSTVDGREESEVRKVGAWEGDEYEAGADYNAVLYQVAVSVSEVRGCKETDRHISERWLVYDGL